MRVKENEYKENIKYDWCASKENNTNGAWRVTWKLGHIIHHHTRSQHSVNGTRHDSSPLHQRAPSLLDGRRRLLP